MLLSESIAIVARLDYLLVKAALQIHGIRTISDRTAKMRKLLAEKIAAGELTKIKEENFYMKAEDIETVFSYAPADVQKKEDLERINEAAKKLALLIVNLTSESTDQAFAVRKCHDVVKQANLALNKS